MKYLIFLLKYSKYNIPYKEYKLLFSKGNDEIGNAVIYLRKKLNLNSLNKKEVEKIYIAYKLKMLKIYHYNNHKFKDNDVDDLIKFLMIEAKERFTFFDAIEFHNYVIQKIPKTFPLFSRFIYSDNSNWVKLKLPFNSLDSAYFVNSESEIHIKFNSLFKNPYLNLDLSILKTTFDDLENKIYYEYDVVDQHKKVWGKVFFFQYSKSFQN